MDLRLANGSWTTGGTIVTRPTRYGKASTLACRRVVRDGGAFVHWLFRLPSPMLRIGSVTTVTAVGGRLGFLELPR